MSYVDLATCAPLDGAPFYLQLSVMLAGNGLRSACDLWSINNPRYEYFFLKIRWIAQWAAQRIVRRALRYNGTDVFGAVVHMRAHHLLAGRRWKMYKATTSRGTGSSVDRGGRYVQDRDTDLPPIHRASSTYGAAACRAIALERRKICSCIGKRVHQAECRRRCSRCWRWYA